MTEQEKQLLLRDLCARVPYGVKFKFGTRAYILDGVSQSSVHKNELDWFADSRDSNVLIPIEVVKPYLRPLSSITEDEKEEACNNGLAYIDSGRYETDDGTKILYGGKSFQLIPGIDTIDWLNANHFDYRGLIDKGLAIAAPDGMYK